MTIDPELLHGAFEVVRSSRGGVAVHRLPSWVRRQAADPQLDMVESQPSGVRLVFDTAATQLSLTALAHRFRYAGLPERARGVFDLVVDGELFAQSSLMSGVTVTIDIATGHRTIDDAEPERLAWELPGGHKRVEIWLPHLEQVELLDLEADAPVARVSLRAPVWLHHGSSISHGSNASHPTGTWPALAARARGWSLVNLGFGGSALADPAVARVMRDTPADLISVKLGINVVNADVMRRRAFRMAVHGFLDTVREGHADTPVMVISPLHCALHESVPGPGAFDPVALSRGEMRFIATGDPAEVASGRLSLETVREELASIVAQRAAEDPHLTFLDGLDLYGAADEATEPLVDGLHPSGATHRSVAKRFAALAWPGR